MNNRITRRTAIGGLAAGMLTMSLTACHAGLTDTFTVGSKEFTEELLLGELYAQLLEYGGMKVRRRLGLGGTQVAMAALRRGSIDLYPEYTGTALLNQLKLPLIRNSDELYQTVSREYRKRYNLVWLDQAPMNDTQALAVTRAFSERHHISTLSELAAAASGLRLGAVPEFIDRVDGLPGLQKVYGGFKFAKVRILDSGLKYRALLANDVDVVVAFGTDGAIASDNLVVLTDDKHFWPAYHVAPVVRAEALAKHPLIARLLNPLAPHLTDAVMSGLNEQIDGKKRDTVEVATEFLRQSGLVRG